MAKRADKIFGVDTTDWYIELDCAPGTPRPDTVLFFVLEGTALTPLDFTNSGTFFGNWTFCPNPEKLEEYGKAREHIAARISEAYDAGRIRYGSC